MNFVFYFVSTLFNVMSHAAKQHYICFVFTVVSIKEVLKYFLNIEVKTA